MNRLLERIHAIGTHAWLRFLQILNGLLIAAAAVLEAANAFYPGVLAGVAAKLPPMVGLPLVILTGLVIHYAARRAKKAATAEAQIAARLSSIGVTNG